MQPVLKLTGGLLGVLPGLLLMALGQLVTGGSREIDTSGTSGVASIVLGAIVVPPAATPRWQVARS